MMEIKQIIWLLLNVFSSDISLRSAMCRRAHVHSHAVKASHDLYIYTHELKKKGKLMRQQDRVKGICVFFVKIKESSVKDNTDQELQHPQSHGGSIWHNKHNRRGLIHNSSNNHAIHVAPLSVNAQLCVLCALWPPPPHPPVLLSSAQLSPA